MWIMPAREVFSEFQLTPRKRTREWCGESDSNGHMMQGWGLVGGTTLLKTIKAKSKSTIRVKSRLLAVNHEPRQSTESPSETKDFVSPVSTRPLCHTQVHTTAHNIHY
jgi:hypothetical protein